MTIRLDLQQSTWIYHTENVYSDDEVLLRDKRLDVCNHVQLLRSCLCQAHAWCGLNCCSYLTSLFLHYYLMNEPIWDSTFWDWHDHSLSNEIGFWHFHSFCEICYGIILEFFHILWCFTSQLCCLSRSLSAKVIIFQQLSVISKSKCVIYMHFN